MAQLWSDILQEGSFGGVKFDFVSVRDEHSNDTDQQRLPGRPGTKVVPRTRNGNRYEVLAIFIDDDYPEKMNNLIAQLDDGGVVKKLVHPIFGEVNASCERFSVSHDAEDGCDSGTITITFIEDNDANLGPTTTLLTTPAMANAVRTQAEVTLAALAAFGDATTVQIAAVRTAVALAISIADQFDAIKADVSSIAIEATANAGLTKIDAAIVLVADYETTEQYDLGAALQALASELRELTETLLEARPTLTEHVVVADTNLLALVFAVYGSSDRVEEVMALNSIPDPSLIPVGFRLKFYAG